MGLIIGEDYEAGSDCASCWSEAIALIKGVGWKNTPKYVLATFSGVILCFGSVIAVDGEWLLTQINPCQWGYATVDIGIVYTSAIAMPFPMSTLTVFTSDGGGGNAFSGQGDPCDISFDNLITNCAGLNVAKDGNGFISWGPGIAP